LNPIDIIKIKQVGGLFLDDKIIFIFSDTVTYQTAVKIAENFKLCGISGWKIPKIEELKGIKRALKKRNMLDNNNFFRGKVIFWSQSKSFFGTSQYALDFFRIDDDVRELKIGAGEYDETGWIFFNGVACLMLFKKLSEI
jgi:hypothetical protein